MKKFGKKKDEDEQPSEPTTNIEEAKEEGE